MFSANIKTVISAGLAPIGMEIFVFFCAQVDVSVRPKNELIVFCRDSIEKQYYFKTLLKLKKTPVKRFGFMKAQWRAVMYFNEDEKEMKVVLCDRKNEATVDEIISETAMLLHLGKRAIA
ncbi:hypothetical protein DN068_04055 [Taibaiella soli]|uniref:Uncharacterized protein n=2 Tax=Taibaiella soli TaxID=1649169 RepID=A0A2W2BD73_9BACT|nr:hypothetical protein DN068_04055 [Taibaiella soli]